MENVFPLHLELPSPFLNSSPCLRRCCSIACFRGDLLQVSLAFGNTCTPHHMSSRLMSSYANSSSKFDARWFEQISARDLLSVPQLKLVVEPGGDFTLNQWKDTEVDFPNEIGIWHLISFPLSRGLRTDTVLVFLNKKPHPKPLSSSCMLYCQTLLVIKIFLTKFCSKALFCYIKASQNILKRVFSKAGCCAASLSNVVCFCINI